MSAWVTIGPRQTIGCSASTRKPIDIAPTPWLVSGLQVLAIRGRRALAGESQHQRLARSVDVGVQDPDPGTLRGPGERQIHGHRGLADAALAGGDGDDVADLPERLEVALHGVRADVGLQARRSSGTAMPAAARCAAKGRGQLRLVAARPESPSAMRAVTPSPCARTSRDRLRGAQGLAEVGVDVRFQGGAHGVD